MITLLFIQFVSSSMKMTSIIRGNWSFRTIYPPDSNAFDERFIVHYRGDIPNYLFTTLGDENIDINVSFVDLSGNFTYLENVYDFNFTMKARPYISTDINLYEYGIAHCTFCSYSSMHCLWVVDNNTYSIFGERENFANDNKPFYIRYRNNIIMVVAAGLILYGFHFATNKLQQNLIEDMRKEEEKKRQEKLKNEENKEIEGENNEKVEDEANKKEEEDKNETHEITEQIPDENGKVKTD